MPLDDDPYCLHDSAKMLKRWHFSIGGHALRISLRHKLPATDAPGSFKEFIGNAIAVSGTIGWVIFCGYLVFSLGPNQQYREAGREQEPAANESAQGIPTSESTDNASADQPDAHVKSPEGITRFLVWLGSSGPAEWTLVCIAGLAATVGLWTLLRISDQARTARKGTLASLKVANAAKASAETAGTSLRLAHQPHLDIKGIGHNNSPAILTGKPIDLTITFKLFNPGSVPATVTRVDRRYGIDGGGWIHLAVAGQPQLISPTKAIQYDIPIGILSEAHRLLYASTGLVIDLRISVSFDGPLEQRTMTFDRKIVCGPSGTQSIRANLNGHNGDDQ